MNQTWATFSPRAGTGLEQVVAGHAHAHPTAAHPPPRLLARPARFRTGRPRRPGTQRAPDNLTRLKVEVVALINMKKLKVYFKLRL